MYGSCVDSPDYVLVRDGPDNLVIARYCGGHTSPDDDVIPAVMTSSSRATVEFVSDARNQRQGFAGHFTFVAFNAQSVTVPAPGPSGITNQVVLSTLAGHQADHQLLQPEDSIGKQY